MADVKISALPAATTPLVGTELVPIVQSGTTSRVSVDNLTAGKTVAASTVNVDANTASAAVRITQTGAGNALVVEDAANPDATPFVVDADGSLITGGTARFTTATTGGARIQTITGSATISRFANDANPQRLEFVKSRSTTSGSAATVVQSGDTLGQVNWQGADGTAFVIAAAIEAAVDGTPGTNDMPGRLVFSTTADGAASPTERMRITATGSLCLGTTNPSGSRFRIFNDRAVNSFAQIWSTTNGGSFENDTLLSFDGSAARFGNFQSFPLAFLTNNLERMRITAAGNVVAGGSVALATTATDGFLYVPTCAGVPTGTPTAITGMAPIVVNTTNNKLYFYSGGAWRDAGP